MLWKYLQRSFGGGFLDKELSGRQDLAKYFQGASKIKNLLVRRQGNLQKRRGTDLVANLNNLLGLDRSGRQIPIGKMRMVAVECNDDGRFLLLTNNCAFVGNRDGILTCGGSYVREIQPYDALDSDGYRKVYCGKDAMANSSSPVCIITGSGASRSVTWYATLSAAAAAVTEGCTVQLHANIVVKSEVVFNAVSFTLDLCGYEIRVSGNVSAVKVSRFGVQARHFVITSSRTGARITQAGVAGDVPMIEFFADSSSTSVAATLTIDGGIKFATSGSHPAITSSFCKTVTINSGEFVNSSALGFPLLDIKGIECVINSGSYELSGTFGNCVRFTGANNTCGITVNYGRFVHYITDGTRTREVTCAIRAVIGYVRTRGGTIETTHSTVFSSSSTIGGIDVGRLLVSYEGSIADADIAYIDEGNQKSHPDTNVHNDAFPTAKGWYGWKQAGDADYDGGKLLNGDQRPYCIATPYSDDDIERLCVKQVGDSLFIAHRAYPPAKIVFDAYGIPTIDDIVFDANMWKRPRMVSAEMVGNDHESISESTTITKQWVNTSSTTTHQGDDSVTTYEGKFQEATNTSSTTTTTPESPHTVKYAVTYVKDDFESMMSEPIDLDYMRPWNTGATADLKFNKGDNADEPDYYNIYKDNGGGFGLIGSTNNAVGAVTVSAFANTDKLWTVVPESSSFENALDYEQRIGVGAGGLTNRISGRSRRRFPNLPSADCCVFTSTATTAQGLKLTINSREVRAIRVWLDGRIYDKQTDTSWIIISSITVGGEWRGVLKGRTQAGTYTIANRQATEPSDDKVAGVFTGFDTNLGIYDDFVGRATRQFTLPNGDIVFGTYVGRGRQTEWFNSHRRKVDINLEITEEGKVKPCESVEYVTLKFTTGGGAAWTSNQQGCVHAVEFMPARITGTEEADSVWQDSYVTPDMSIVPPNELDQEHFSGAGDYPACVGMWGEKAQRLCFASTENNPLGFWLSVAGDLYNFTQHKSVREDDAIEASIAATEKPNINHIIVIRDLMLLTDGGEWAVSPVTGNALSYKTVAAKQHSQIGAHRNIEPIAVGDEMMFCNSTGEVLRAVKYNAISENYETQDLSVLSQRLFRANPIRSMAFKRHPDSVVECVLADGTIATLVYMREHEMAAWSLQELGGGYKAKEIGCTKSVINGTSEMMITAVRDGEWSILKVKDDCTDNAIEHQVCMDAVREMSGLDLAACANEHMTAVHKLTGTVVTQDEIASGKKSVNINDQYVVGFPFVSELITMRPEPQGQADTIQMEIKNATEMEIRVIDSSTFRFGANGDDRYLRTVELKPTIPSAGRIDFVDRDVRLPISGNNSRDGRVKIVHDAPFAFVLLSVGVTYQVEQSNQNGRGGDEG